MNSQQKKCRLEIKLKPQAKRDTLSISADGTFVLAVTAPPVDGKANEHAIRVLAKMLHITKSSCVIIRGQTSRMKLFEITGLDIIDARRILNETAERKV